MGWGQWTRWGRGACEGYGLEIGHLLRFSVTANTDRTLWRVTLNTRELGAYDDFDQAIAAAEKEARHQMTLALENWATFQTQPKARRRAARRR